MLYAMTAKDLHQDGLLLHEWLLLTTYELLIKDRSTRVDLSLSHPFLLQWRGGNTNRCPEAPRIAAHIFS
jgi:hypothetical protein